MRDSIISMSFFFVVLSVQHLFSSLGDYSHGWVCVCVWLPQQLRVQMYRDQQTDNTQSCVYCYATSVSVRASTF